MPSLDDQREKAWRYVGRFMWAFAGVESCLDSIFQIMFNLEGLSFFLVLTNVDMRKKVKLIGLGFKSQGIDHNKTLKKVHELANLRNVIAHSFFDPSMEGDGIVFSYFDSSKVKSEEEQDAELFNASNIKTEEEEEADLTFRFISYVKLDEYYSQATKLSEVLSGIHCEPVNPGLKIIRDISEIIASADNVIPFRPK